MTFSEFGRERVRHYWAVIAAAAIGAAGSAAGGALQAQGASAAARAGRGKLQQVPEPPYATALNNYVARLIAANATNQPPSFAQYISSGGRDTFPMTATGLSPQQLQRLGFVDPSGQPIPFGSPNQTSLTPEQKLFLGRTRLREAGVGASARQAPANAGPLERYAALTNLEQFLQGQPQTEPRQDREERVQGRLTNLRKRLGIG